jgi:hypothetical protein
LLEHGGVLLVEDGLQFQSLQSFSARPHLLPLDPTAAEGTVYQRGQISEAVLADEVLLETDHEGPSGASIVVFAADGTFAVSFPIEDAILGLLAREFGNCKLFLHYLQVFVQQLHDHEVVVLLCLLLTAVDVLRFFLLFYALILFMTGARSTKP